MEIPVQGIYIYVYIIQIDKRHMLVNGAYYTRLSLFSGFILVFVISPVDLKILVCWISSR